MIKDEVPLIQQQVRAWVADPDIDVIITNGGTGITGRDVTPEALKPIFEKEIEGFGELFRMISYQKVGTSTMQSRAVGGMAGGTYIFALPGSPRRARTAGTRSSSSSSIRATARATWSS